MSPRRKFEPGQGALLVATDPATQRRRWELPVASSVAGVLMAVAITLSTVMLISHQSREHAASKDREVLNYVTGFMTEFTSLDPYHANDYVMRVLAQATGDFAKQYHDKANEILLQVARAEPAKGIILGAAVERWNDDGSATVMVATEVTSKSPDQKQVVENTNRWTATATREGNQWKISNLLQVI
jgi:Mce-associated membrane protein